MDVLKQNSEIRPTNIKRDVAPLSSSQMRRVLGTALCCRARLLSFGNQPSEALDRLILDLRQALRGHRDIAGGGTC